MTCAQTTPTPLTRPRRHEGRFRAFYARWCRARALWRQRRALAALDDRLLDDVGLTREQAQAEARKGFWEV